MIFSPQTILDFWFKESTPEDWFKKSDAYDQKIKERFASDIAKLATADLEEVVNSPEEALAAVLVLDQFTRNVYRDQPESFSYDAKALEFAKTALAKGFDKELPEEKRRFLYMPFMHSENLADHEQAVELFSSLADKTSLEYEYKHKRIIERFGRYPHRNQILGRESTEEELDFLKNEEDSSF